MHLNVFLYSVLKSLLVIQSQGKENRKRISFSLLLTAFFFVLLADISNILITIQRVCSWKQCIYYSASSLYIFRVSTTPIIRSTQNCNYNLRYWLCCAVQLPPSNVAKLGIGVLVWPRWREVAAQKIWPVPKAVVSFVSSWWWVWLTPETCRVNFQNNK